MFANSHEALEAIGKSLNLGKLAFKSDGICPLNVGDDLELEIEDQPDRGVMRLNANIRAVEDADASVLRTLLVANFNGQGTGPASLSINSASGEIVLTQALDPRHYDVKSLTEELDAFVRLSIAWVDYAAKLRPSSEDVVRPVGEADAESVMMLRL